MGNFTPQMRTLAEAKVDPRGMIRREIDKFTGRWYLDKWYEKFFFILGFLSFLGGLFYLLFFIL